MIFSSRTLVPACLLVAVLGGLGCGDGSTSDDSGGGPVSTSSSSVSLPTLTGNNVMALTVNGSQCSVNSYPNKPCVSVTVCEPNTSNCQTINDILLDTGSYGLRIFSSNSGGPLSLPLAQVFSGSGALAECVQFGDGSADWGPVQMATVILGGESPVTVPIHVIDASFAGGAPASCGTPDQSPADAGFNGILGVGLFAQDCGSYCTTSASNGMYYKCDSSGCTGVKAPTQVLNPVTALSQDNNGVIVELPSIGLGGEGSANGYLVMGIGTQANNTPSGVRMFSADLSGEFSVQFNGKSYKSFIDTGSNGLFFTGPSNLPECGSDASGWFCPSGTNGYTATNIGQNGAQGSVSFKIGNAESLMGSNNSVFVELGGSGPGEFDWGLPFHLGRSVYVGFENSSSSLGTGPYWAY